MSYDSFLPVLDLAQFADDARRLMGYKMFYGGFGIIALGLLIKSTHNMLRIMRSETADLMSPILAATLFTAILVFYKAFVTTTIYLVSHMGITTHWNDSIVDTFVTRYETYLRWRAEFGSYNTLVMEIIVGILYLLVEACVVFFRAGQTFILAVIIVFGPLLLGAASLGSFFVPLAIGWFWALIEVSAWSVTMDVLLFGYSKMKHVVEVKDIDIKQEFIFGVTMFGLLLVIPALTSWLIRGTAGAAMGTAYAGALRTTRAVATSHVMRSVNTSLYDTVKSWVRPGGGAPTSSSNGSTASTTPAQAWAQSRASAQRGQREQNQ